METDATREFENLAKEYAGQYYLVSEENHPKEDEVKALNDLIEYHHQQLQKAREEEVEKSQVEVLAAVTGLQEALDNAPITLNQDIDITEVPDGLAHELRGMKKGWHAALEQLKQQLFHSELDQDKALQDNK